MNAHRFVGTLAILLASTPAFAQVQLQTKLPREGKQQFSLNKALRQTLTINGNDITSEVDDHALLEAAYSERDDGQVVIDYRYAGWQVDVDVNGDKIRFDAANPNEGDSDSPIAVLLDGYRCIAKTPFKLLVEDSGRVTDFQGWDDILDGLEDRSKALHAEMFDTDYLRALWTAEFQRLPDQPVQIGDTWTRTVEYRFQGGQGLTFTTEYKYVGPLEKDGRTFQKVDVTTSKVEYTGQADESNPLILSEAKLRVEDAEGELLFDEQRQQVTLIKEKLHVQGELTFTVRSTDKSLPGKLDLHVETEQILLP